MDDIEEKHARHTIGFRVAVPERKEKGLNFLVEEVLKGVCAVSLGDILCLQDLPAQGVYDVTFHDAPVCARALERLQAAAAHEEALGGVQFCPGPVNRQVSVTVQMYNPFCSENAVAAFLSVYCEAVGEGVKLCDGFPVWNGRRRFPVTLDVDEDGFGGTRHPPAVFDVGLDIGFLYYPGQPEFCSTCSAFGHFSPACPQYGGGDSEEGPTGRFPTRLQAELHWREYAENLVHEDVELDHPDVEDLGGPV